MDAHPSHSHSVPSSSSSSSSTHTTQQYVLRHFLITGSSGSFYDPVGNVNPDHLRQLVHKCQQDFHQNSSNSSSSNNVVIGWFRARRQSPARLTLRESAVWRSILKLGPRHGHHDIFTVDPLLALFAVTPQATTSALTYDYRFLDPSVGGLDPKYLLFILPSFSLLILAIRFHSLYIPFHRYHYVAVY